MTASISTEKDLPFDSEPRSRMTCCSFANLSLYQCMTLWQTRLVKPNDLEFVPRLVSRFDNVNLKHFLRSIVQVVPFRDLRWTWRYVIIRFRLSRHTFNIHHTSVVVASLSNEIYSRLTSTSFYLARNGAFTFYPPKSRAKRCCYCRIDWKAGWVDSLKFSLL